MLDFGIYIPEQDASWELVPNAFQELLHRHNRCDAGQCLCPKGRFHEMAGTRWELILCRYCGSQGIHVGCGSLKWSNPEWECKECKTMLQQAQEQYGTDNEDEPAPSPSSVVQPPPRQRQQHNRRLGVPRKSRHHKNKVPALPSDPPPSSQNPLTPESQSATMTSGPVSPPTPISVIEVSDDDVIEILDDDDDDDDDDKPPAKKPSQDNCNMILSSDGVAIPVIQVTSIPTSNDGQSFCVVGDLNVKVPGQLDGMQQARVQPPLVLQAKSAVSHVSTSNTGGQQSRPSGTSGSLCGSSCESSICNKPLDSTSAVTYIGQSAGSTSALGIAAGEGGLLKSYLMFEDAQRGYPSTGQVSLAVQQMDSSVSSLICSVCRMKPI